MGYYIQQIDSKFFIAAKDKPMALQAIRYLRYTENSTGSGRHSKHGKTVRHFSWVDTSTFDDINTLEGMLEEWGWLTSMKITNDIVDICFNREKLGDETILFEAIAPYVKHGSYIQMQGEEGSLWRWVFKNGQFEQIFAKITWD